MRDIWTYNVSFPYGATTAPYTKANPHRGEDRAAPKGTPITVNGIVIGLVGTTGKSTGNHLHVQKVAGGVVRPPHGGGATMPNPEVYETGTRADIGNYVRIKDSNGVQWSYFHLSEIKVGRGKLSAPSSAGEEMIADRQQAELAYILLRGTPGSEAELNATAGKRTWAEFASSGRAEVNNREAYKKQLEKQVADQQKTLDTQSKQIAELGGQLAVIKSSVDELNKRPTQDALDKLQSSYDSLAKDYANVIKRAEETPPSVPKPQPKPKPFSFSDWFSKFLKDIRRR